MEEERKRYKDVVAFQQMEHNQLTESYERLQQSSQEGKPPPD